MYSGKKKDLNRLVNTAGWIWNHAIALSKKYYALYRKHLSSNRLQKHIAKLRNKNKAWQMLSAQTVQEICQRIEKSYKAFFSWVKKRTGSRKSPPKFRKVKKFKSFTFKQDGFKLAGNRITINKLGKTFSFHKSRDYGKPKTITIKRDSVGAFWIIIVCGIEENKIKFTTGKTAGFDFSMKEFLVSSDCVIPPPPLFFSKSEKLLAKASRELSRKKKGSNNRKKARLKLARLHIKIANQRNDYQWQLANYLVKRFDVLTFEHLNLDAFKKIWGKKVNDFGFGDFLHKVEYLCRKYGKEFIQASRWFPSSKLCSGCGYKKEALALSERTYTCESCGLVIDRDKNASINLDNLGMILSSRIVDVGLNIPSNLRVHANGRKLESPCL